MQSSAPAKPKDVYNLSESGSDSINLIPALQIILATLCGFVIVGTLAWEWRHNFAMPLYDDIFDRLRLYRALGNPKALFEYFISSHNEHRILTTRLLAALDEFSFSGREHTQIIATNVMQLIAVSVTYHMAFRSDPGRHWTLAERLLVFATIALLFINPSLLYTLIVPFQVQHVIMALLCIIAAGLMARASTQAPSRQDFLKLLFALLLLAFIASFTLGNSPVILLAAAATAIVLRWPLYTIVILSVLALAHVAIVLATTQLVGTQSDNVMAILSSPQPIWVRPFCARGLGQAASRRGGGRVPSRYP